MRFSIYLHIFFRSFVCSFTRKQRSGWRNRRRKNDECEKCTQKKEMSKIIANEEKELYRNGQAWPVRDQFIAQVCYFVCHANMDCASADHFFFFRLFLVVSCSTDWCRFFAIRSCKARTLSVCVCVRSCTCKRIQLKLMASSFVDRIDFLFSPVLRRHESQMKICRSKMITSSVCSKSLWHKTSENVPARQRWSEQNHRQMKISVRNIKCLGKSPFCGCRIICSLTTLTQTTDIHRFVYFG